MYLKFIRHKHFGPARHRGSLYRVHFQPNEKGGYNETLTHICDAYELGNAAELIYPAGLTQKSGRMCLTFGLGTRRSVLHLMDAHVREVFLPVFRRTLASGEEVRIELV